MGKPLGVITLSYLKVIQFSHSAAFNEPALLYGKYFAAKESMFPVWPCNDFAPFCYHSVTSL
jgi:hypothetical protein